MLVSAQILTILRDSLSLFVNRTGITYERYQLPLQLLEMRQDIKIARIALYEATGVPDGYVNDRRPDMIIRTYGVDISVVKPHVDAPEEDTELLALDLKDLVMAWAQTAPIQALTGGHLVYWAYSREIPLFRNPRFVTLTLFFDAKRDYLLSQTEVIQSLPSNC